MALPTTGSISLANIQTEFGGTNPMGLNEYYRGGALVPASSSTIGISASGAIAANNFYGKTRRVDIPLSISSPTYNYDVYSNLGPDYVAGISDVTVTVAPGVQVGSTSTSTYALLVPSAFNQNDTVTIVNNGVIQGMGGGGGDSVIGAVNGPPGAGGGNALYINRPTTIQNNNVIAGGGGGGGAGGGGQDAKGPARVGGGGGGGAGFNGGAGGAGPSPGGAGTSASGGGGGGGDAASGGPGGGRGASGSNGPNSGGANPRSGGAGGTAGFYVVGNPFVTWAETGTLQGPAG